MSFGVIKAMYISYLFDHDGFASLLILFLRSARELQIIRRFY